MNINQILDEGADERKQNALWAQITDYEKRAKATKNDIKKAHYEKMANELRSKLKTSDNLEEGDVAKLAGITALGIGAGLGANYLDQQAPRVEFDGKNGQVVKAYLEPAYSNRIPDNAMTIKGKDGKTYHVWSSSGKGMTKSYHAAPAEEVKEGLPQTLRKVVPGYAKREIDQKMDAGKFGKTDADKDANFQRYKKIQDKLKEGDKKPHPKTWHDVDPKLGKEVDKMSQVEKVKKGLAHPDTLKKKGVAEGKPAKPEQPEADYGDDYQAMVARVKKLAGMGPLKTVYDPQKRVYKNVPTAVQPKK